MYQKTTLVSAQITKTKNRISIIEKDYKGKIIYRNSIKTNISVKTAYRYFKQGLISAF